MSRRTPTLAIILAPLVLYLLVSVWNKALVPFYRSIRYSDTVLQWRLNSDVPAVRIGATADIAKRPVVDADLINELALRLHTDESAGVRSAAANALGQRGARQPLTGEALQALSALVLTAPEPELLSAAIVAVGQSAPNNRYTDEIVGRIAEIFSEKHLAWLYPRAATTLGQLGAAQPLPDTVFAVMNESFSNPVRPGEREHLANAFTEIAKGRRLPPATLDLIAAALASERNRRVRIAIIYALAYAAPDYPGSTTVITAATNDADPDIVRAAESGLRIIEGNEVFGGKDPLALAIDSAQPAEVRVRALQIIRSTRIEAAAFEPVATLARDAETEVAVAALGVFHHLARAPNDDFDERVLIPELTRAMSSPDARVRNAAYGALSTISVHRPGYPLTGDFPAQLELGANDPDPKVRIVVLVTMLRAARGNAQRDLIIERAMTDADPYVRRNAVGWMGSPRIQTSKRETFIDRALNDPDPDVRASAAQSAQTWASRERSWPVELWRQWQAGEIRKVGMTVLITVTVATPVLVCAGFLLYFMARFLSYLLQRRWRAAAVVPVVAAWVAASYAMVMLFFVAGFAGDLDAGELAILTSVLWGAIAAYTALGWGMHFAVRR